MRTSIFYLIGLCLMAPIISSAQSGIVQGSVTEAGNNSTLPGATVYIEALNMGVVTDVDGAFTLSNVPVGEHLVRISFLGFDSKEETVQVTDNEIYTLNIKLGESGILGEEVIVSGQRLGQAKAINQQLNAESIANIVSADRIQELPDVNAAEAISRLPGISIQRSGGEGQKVIVRGLAPKFSAITVNGVRLPGNAGTDRSVDLSLISPELLDGIEVFKSPLPDMDAESLGGTVNLSLRKAPEQAQFLVRGLGGYNWQNETFGDYKGIVQFGKRVFNNKLGIIVQTNIERFNRGGDFLTYTYTAGGTDPETGITNIAGNTATFIDGQERRRRFNTSFNLDYDLGKSTFGLFGLYSNQQRDRYEVQNSYQPNQPIIAYTGRGRENNLNMFNLSLTGEHKLGWLTIDWNISGNRSDGNTPYDFQMQFDDGQIPFDAELNPQGHPKTFKEAGNPDFTTSFLRRNRASITSTLEDNQSAMLNLKMQLSFGDKIGGYFKFGGKYTNISRERNVERFAEDFYYLGGEFTRNAAAQWGRELAFSRLNGQQISVTNFLADNNDVLFKSDISGDVNFDAKIDEDKVRSWYDNQFDILNKDRGAIPDNYTVDESIVAAYAMLKLEFGPKLSVIPGFRIERSDNSYDGVRSTINGRYGVNGFFSDTTTFQEYTEFLPHLHIKYKPLEWFDIRASMSTTLARPDFDFLIPTAKINDTNLSIDAGNPTLRHTVSRNFDLFFSAYDSKWGLLTIGGFYKQIDDLFTDQEFQLIDQELANETGFPTRTGYRIDSYVNLGNTDVYGIEIDIQTNLGFLPYPFNGLVFNANYARLFSETETFFLTSETVLVIPFPPVFETTFMSNARTVAMPSQSPDILNASLGYDLKGFSARVSANFQGTRADSYATNKDFDRFTLEFWRMDVSIKQRVGDNWSFFLNLNNITRQEDITFVRTEEYTRGLQAYGMTGTIGAQYKL